MPAQDLHTNGVERAHPWHAFNLSNQIANPVFHLSGGFIRKSHRKNLIGARCASVEQMRDAGGQSLGLTSARPGEHQNRPIQLLHSRALRRVQPLHIRRWAGSHGHLAQAGGCGGLKGI